MISKTKNETSFRRRCSSSARHGSPLRAIAFKLELGTRVEGLRHVSRVVDDGHDEQPGILTWIGGEPVEVFRDGRTLAVGRAVLTQITFAEICGDDLQRAALIDQILRGRSS